MADKNDFLKRFGGVESAIPESKAGNIDELVNGFLSLNVESMKFEKVAKHSVPFINSKAKKLKLPLKAVTRKGIVYMFRKGN